MQKSLMISLSTLFVISSSMADSIELERYGIMVTKECLDRGEFMDCPLEQLQKISNKNPLLLYSADQYSAGDYFENYRLTYNKHEQKIYILDFSDMDKSKIEALGFKGNILVTGVLQADQTTLKIKNIIHNPLPRSVWKGGL